ncbi:MAG: triphosphoribosyl-dephospho-CoA synthase [Sulfolobales archaeon]
MKLRRSWHSVARSFGSAFVIEMISPKISGVTALESVKNLTPAQFVHTSFYIYSTIKSMLSYEGCVPLGESLLNIMDDILKNPVIGTNTCLGYGLVALSLASTILYSLRANECDSIEECVLRGYDEFKYCLTNESTGDLVKSIELASPSYHGQYYSPKLLSNVFELLLESSIWDLVAYNIVNKFSITLDLYNFAKSATVGELLRYTSELYRYAASKYFDSISFKSGGIMLSRLVREVASKYTPSSYEARDVLVNKVGVNLGSISDLVASSIALVLLRVEWGL